MSRASLTAGVARGRRALVIALVLAGSGLIALSASGSASAASGTGGATAPGDAGTSVPALGGTGARTVQQRLVALHYLPAGAVSGRWDYSTSQALLAFQGWEGLGRDGTAGPQTLGALRRASAPRPLRPGSGRSIEVFRDRGVTLLIDGSSVVLAVHSSSGRLGHTTPAGSFRVFRKELRSWSYPYAVWLPYASYFNGGIAFHAYNDVPAYAASHGCVRIAVPFAATVYSFARLGTPVFVY